MARAGSLPVWALLIGGALVTWIVTYERMYGMDGGPGTDRTRLRAGDADGARGARKG